jgi:hypothetical protein
MGWPSSDALEVTILELDAGPRRQRHERKLERLASGVEAPSPRIPARDGLPPHRASVSARCG